MKTITNAIIMGTSDEQILKDFDILPALLEDVKEEIDATYSDNVSEDEAQIIYDNLDARYLAK